MSADKPIRRIAIVGTGVIGASWAALFMAHGLEVIATDPAPNAEENLREYIDTAWPALEQLGLSSGASKERLSFTTRVRTDALEESIWSRRTGRRGLTSDQIVRRRRWTAPAPATAILASSDRHSDWCQPVAMQTS